LYPDASGQPALVVAHDCQDVNQGKVLDLVTIFLERNDLFSDTDETIEAGMSEVFLNLDHLIEMIRKASPSPHVALLLPVPPSASQDPFGSNYGSGQTRWPYKRNILRLVEHMLIQYVDRPGVHIVPTNLGLDCVDNYPTETAKANAVSDIPVTRQNNSVHPSQQGDLQIGDSLFDWIKGQ